MHDYAKRLPHRRRKPRRPVRQSWHRCETTPPGQRSLMTSRSSASADSEIAASHLGERASRAPATLVRFSVAPATGAEQPITRLRACGAPSKWRRFFHSKSHIAGTASASPIEKITVRSGNLTAQSAAVTGSRNSSEGSAQRRWSKMPPRFSRAHKTRATAADQLAGRRATCPPPSGRRSAARSPRNAAMRKHSIRAAPPCRSGSRSRASPRGRSGWRAIPRAASPAA